MTPEKIGLTLLLIAVAAQLPARPTTAAGPLSAEKFAVSLIFVSFAYSGWNAAA